MKHGESDVERQISIQAIHFEYLLELLLEKGRKLYAHGHCLIQECFTYMVI